MPKRSVVDGNQEGNLDVDLQHTNDESFEMSTNYIPSEPTIANNSDLLLPPNVLLLF
jgi:hypothetical protein